MILELWMFDKADRVTLVSADARSSTRSGLSFASNSQRARREIASALDILISTQGVLQVCTGEPKPLAGVAPVVTQELRMHLLAPFDLLLLKGARSWSGTDSGRSETPKFFFLALIAIASWWTRNQVALETRLVFARPTITSYLWDMTVMALSILRYMLPMVGPFSAFVPSTFTKGGVVVKDPYAG